MGTLSSYRFLCSFETLIVIDHRILIIYGSIFLETVLFINTLDNFLKWFQIKKEGKP